MPTNRAGQIGALLPTAATVAFQFKGDTLPPLPLADGSGQRGHQQILDLGAVRPMTIAQ
ncbi:hypothetical protein D3C80_1909510 [compost metagenome]